MRYVYVCKTQNIWHIHYTRLPDGSHCYRATSNPTPVWDGYTQQSTHHSHLILYLFSYHTDSSTTWYTTVGSTVCRTVQSAGMWLCSLTPLRKTSELHTNTNVEFHFMRCRINWLVVCMGHVNDTFRFNLVVHLSSSVHVGVDAVQLKPAIYLW